MLLQVELPAKYKTGHEHIDGHHTHLFNIIYTIVNLIKNKEKYTFQQLDEEVFQLFKQFHNYTQNHFKYEERVMEKCNYPDIENHRELHRGFVKRIIDIQKESSKFHEGNLALLNETIMFLRDWYLEHVFVEDKKLIAFQKQKKAS